MSTLGSIGDLWFGLSKKARLGLVAGVAAALVVGLVAYGVVQRVQIDAQERQAAEQAQAEQERQAEEESQQTESAADEDALHASSVELVDVAEHAADGIPVDKLPASCAQWAQDFEQDLKRLADEKYAGKGVAKARLDAARSLTENETAVAFAVYLEDAAGEDVARLRFSYDKGASSFRMTAAYDTGGTASSQASEGQDGSSSTAQDDRAAEVARQREEQRAREEAEAAQSEQSQAGSQDASQGASSDATANVTEPGTGGVAAGSGNDGASGGSGTTSRPSLPEPSGEGSWSTGGSQSGTSSGDGTWNTGGNGAWTTGE